MANVIKHKRGSGSDPAASDLVVGEVAIRTDVGKLFTKMDNGSVAEIAGGGSDIAINTLSSSSATGGGSATFNGSAYRFTLSAPPSVSAQQLLVSINGVIQKPVAGTGQPSEGFSVDGTDIILGDAPATGSDFFILTFKSLGVSEPADNSVTSAKIVDGAIVNADINASAAIAGTKISPDFGSQNIVTTGTLSSGNFTITSANPSVTFTENDQDPDFGILCNGGQFRLQDITNTANLFTASSTTLRSVKHHDFDAGIDVTGAITATTNITATGNIVSNGNVDITGNLVVDTSTLKVDSSNNRVGIGTTSPSSVLHVDSGISGSPLVTFHQTNGASSADAGLEVETSSTGTYIQRWVNSGSEKMRVTGNGLVGIGTTSPSSFDNSADDLVISTSGNTGITINSGSAGSTSEGNLVFAEGTAGSQDKFRGAIQYKHGEDRFSFYTNNSERVRIDSSGRVGIGHNTPSSFSSAANTLVVSTSSGNCGISINATATNANSNLFFTDGTGSGENGAGRVSYEHQNNALAFTTDSSERMRIDSLGKIGIGTTSPASFLEIASHNNAETDKHDASNYHLHLRNTENDNGEAIGISFAITSDETAVGAAILHERDAGGSQGSLQFLTNSNGSSVTERMRIDSAGRVLIGTTSGNDALVVDGGSDAGTIQTNSTNSNGNMMTFKCSGTSKFFIGSAGSFITGNSGTTNQGIRAEGHLLFATGGASQKMRLGTNGALGVGTNANRVIHGIQSSSQGTVGVGAFENGDSSNGNPVMFFATVRDGSSGESFLQCNRDQDNNGQGVKAVFFIRTNGDCDSDTNSYGGISDIKLKENIVDAKSQWDDIKNIRVRNFNFKDNPNQKMLGVVAQEVETVSAGLVKDCPDENITSPGPEGTSTKSVKYSILYMKAIKALQEAQIRIETLESKVTALEAK